MTHSPRIITWQTQTGADAIDICQLCETRLADRMPRSPRGEKYCRIAHGIRYGECQALLLADLEELRAAARNRAIRRALAQLVGCPDGGWPETRQAMDTVLAAIPHREDRSYTLDELVIEALYLDHADRWQWRPEYAPEVAQ